MRTGLLSIREPYASRIFAGEKRYEFRTRAPAITEPTRFLIYVPSPRKELAGEMTVTEVVEGTPAQLWSTCNGEGGVAADAFHTYFRDRTTAYALRIEDAETYAQPVPLDGLREHLDPGFRPPQYLSWLSREERDVLVAAATGRHSG